MSQTQKTTIAELGKFGLIEHLTKNLEIKQASTIKATGDDAVVVRYEPNQDTVVSTDLLLEGIHFDLTYTPLKHLGYKAVTIGVSNCCAMNAIPRQIMISIGLSQRFFVEDLEDLYAGIQAACTAYQLDLACGDISSSMTGLNVHVTAIGAVKKEEAVFRSGGKPTDLLCLSGNLGAAYMGLQVLEREKKVFEKQAEKQPQLTGYEYILRRYLMPEARKDIITLMREQHIVPSAMIDVSDGLASDVLHICKQSNCGVRIYLERLPIAAETFRMSEEIGIDAVTAALNGGGDYELLFTLPVTMYDTLRKEMQQVDVIGHLCDASEGNYLITPDKQAVEIKAQGWKGAT